MNERTARLREESLDAEPTHLDRARRAADRVLPRERGALLGAGDARPGVPAPVRAQDDLIWRGRADRRRARPGAQGRAHLSRADLPQPSRTSRSSTPGPRPATSSRDECRAAYASEGHPVLARPHAARPDLRSSCPASGTTAYEAGIFTEFMEQRAPGHTVLDDKIYAQGLLDFKRRDRRRHRGARLRRRIRAPTSKREQLQGHGHRLRRGDPASPSATPSSPRSARPNDDPTPRGAPSSSAIAAVCRHVPAHAPRDLPGGAAVLLVLPPGGDHRAERLGRLQPGPPRPAPAARSTERELGRRHADRGQRPRAARVLLHQVQQPPGAAQGRRHRGRERHLHRLRQHQPRRPAAATARTAPTRSRTCCSTSSTRCTCCSRAPTSSSRARRPTRSSSTPCG